MLLQVNIIPSNTFQNADRSSKHFPYKVLWLGLGIGSVLLALLLLSILLGGRNILKISLTFSLFSHLLLEKEQDEETRDIRLVQAWSGNT